MVFVVFTRVLRAIEKAVTRVETKRYMNPRGVGPRLAKGEP